MHPLQAEMIKNLREMIDVTDECTFIQRDLDRLEKWADKNLVKVSKGKWQVLPMRKSNSSHPNSVGTKWLKNSLVEKVWESWWVRRGLWASKMTLQQRPLASWAVLDNVVSRWREVVLPLSTGETHLEFCVHCWANQCKTDMGILEPVQ